MNKIININWKLISISLKEVYKQQNLLYYFEKDEIYLKNAFYIIEKLWYEQLDSIDNLQIVMISESPLFGKIHKYIYNINTRPSSFFYFQDLEAFPNYDCSIQQPMDIKEQKKIMLKEFSKNGFLILDIFPFALNQKDTIINYRKMHVNLYRKLLKITVETYLIPKLNLCFNKSNKQVHFLYRYKRLFKKTGNHFENILEQSLFKKVDYKIDTINGVNMSLDRDKLTDFLK